MKTLIWGLPIRLFHWALVVLVGISFYTGKFGDFDSIDNHMLAGYGIIVLVLFRIGFGIFGNGYHSFRELIPYPKKIFRYLKNPTETPGHNPLGICGVIALLLSLAVQTATGLFTSDEIFVEGPLYHLVSSDTSSLLAQIHGINQWILLGLIATHVIAVLIHELVLKHKILLPMFTGKKQLSEAMQNDQDQQTSHQYFTAVVCLAVAGTATWYLVNYL